MSKAKVSTATKTMKDPELIDMFNKMVGAGDPDPNIVIPKYLRIMSNAEEIIKILQSFIKSPCAKAFSLDFEKSFFEIFEFIKNSVVILGKLQLEKNDKVLSGEELNAINSDPKKIKECLSNINFQYKVARLGEKYKELKESTVIKECVMTARNLKNAVMLEKERTNAKIHNLEDKDALLSDFITRSDGDFLALFSFSSLDFKQMYFSEIMNSDFSKYTLFVLHLIYKKVINIVREITSPDIDVDKFAELLINNIGEIKKHIPRCDKAFEKIKQSVSLLKSNFGEYYKDFITSQNPGIIVEHFVLDVAKSSNEDMEVVAQFRKIIEFYKKNMQNRINDPNVKKIFQMVGENMDILEEKSNKKAQRSSKYESDNKESKTDESIKESKTEVDK